MQPMNFNTSIGLLEDLITAGRYQQSLTLVDTADGGAPLPKGTTYAAEPGDTWLSLAAAANQNPWALAALNRQDHPGPGLPAAQRVALRRTRRPAEAEGAAGPVPRFLSPGFVSALLPYVNMWLPNSTRRRGSNFFGSVHVGTGRFAFRPFISPRRQVERAAVVVIIGETFS